MVFSIVVMGLNVFVLLHDDRLYFTKVQLGSPPRDFYVQIDTGSDVLWVSCDSCNGCPQTSGLPVNLPFLCEWIKNVVFLWMNKKLMPKIGLA